MALYHICFTLFATFHICFASVPFILSLFHMLPFNSLFYFNLFALSFAIFASCSRVHAVWRVPGSLQVEKEADKGPLVFLRKLPAAWRGPSLQLRFRLPHAGGRCHHPHRGQPALGGSCHCSPASAKAAVNGTSLLAGLHPDTINGRGSAEAPHPRAWELWPQAAHSWKHHLILPSHEWVPDMELQGGLFFRKTRSQAKVIQFRPCQVHFWAPPPSKS